MPQSTSKPKNQLWKWKRRFLTRNTNPHMQWMVLLRVFFIVSFCLVIASFYFLYQLKSEQIFQIEKSATSSTTINAAGLQTVTKMLDARAQAQNDIRASAPAEDPSP